MVIMKHHQSCDDDGAPIPSPLPWLRQHYAGEIKVLKQAGRRRRLIRRLTLAGIAGALILSGGFVGGGWHEIKAPANSPMRVELNDGSIIHLDAAARIERPILPWKRSARLLAGTALFDIRHDDSAPFLVESGAATMIDLGTRFLVRMGDDGPHVAVFEGSVELYVNGQVLELPAGKAGQADTTGPVTATMPDEASATGWSQGRLVFRDTPLAEVADALGRYGDVPVILEQPQLAQILVNGSFQLGDTNAALAMLEQGFPLVTAREPDRIILMARKEIKKTTSAK